MNPIEVPNDFINKVMESNGLVNETVNESDATPLNEEVASNETTLNEATAQGEEEIDIDLDVISEVLSENYEMKVDNVDVVASLVEFAYDYMQA